MSALSDEVLYHIALTLVPNIGDTYAKVLLEKIGSPKTIFHTSPSRLESIPGIGPVKARSIAQFRDFSRAEQECHFIERYNIDALCYHSENYPYRLKQCSDPPPVLFYKGNADLNSKKILAVVGTRRSTDIGREIIDAYIDAWRNTGVLVISGLAYGVDQHAHRACVRNGIPTVGVLAHGLDKIYPQSHLSLARQMKDNGGLLTEFPRGTQPDRQNFPRRNRIVAGLSDAVLVVETDVKGGSMITAELASGYNRDVFAIPGRIQDEKSHGCNFLIRENRARLTMHPSDIIEFMNWADEVPATVQQSHLFPDLDEDQRKLLSLVREQGPVHVDLLRSTSGLAHSRFSSALLFLEMEGLLVPLPGKQYRLNEVGGGQNLLRI